MAIIFNGKETINDFKIKDYFKVVSREHLYKVYKLKRAGIHYYESYQLFTKNPSDTKPILEGKVFINELTYEDVVFEYILSYNCKLAKQSFCFSNYSYDWGLRFYC
jgi:hypothetical protein